MNTPIPKPLAKKRVLISGAASGIGRATALQFASAGAEVFMIDLNIGALSEIASQAPDHLHPIECDIRDEKNWSKIIQNQPLDVMINNAAISIPLNIWKSRSKDWVNVWSVNFEAARNGSLTAAEMMKDTGGRIINISSIQALLCERGFAAYGVAKAALEGWTRCLAVELAEFGILVNAVAPGFVDTPMSRATGVNELETDWFKKNYLETGRIPLRRAAQPEEIASAIFFLASPANTYITGQVITIDGGLSITL